ncbi:MAG TPA: hypothetical protein VI452_13250 [Marmoricola sp.]
MSAGVLRSPGPRGVVTVLATLAVAAAGLAAGTVPASSGTGHACPAPYRRALVRGQQVHGLTVSSGTRPASFTGHYLGTVVNGIAPGMDLIVARLGSPAIRRVGGIWQGMSGSPVYARDGRLIGAVSYGLSAAPSPIAGLTPAADLLALAGKGTAAAGAARSRVVLPSRLQRRIVAAGAASPHDAAGGMARLRLPVVVSGLGRRPDRRRLLAAMSGEPGHLVSGSAGGSARPGPIVAGGNLAASLSSGTVTAAGLGTATVVCGHRVVGFGHPMTYQGLVHLGMLNADVIYVQPDNLGGPYKVGNLGPARGVITGDHLAGIVGEQGLAPHAAVVQSRATFAGTTRSGLTRGFSQRYLPEIAASTLYAIQDRAFDHTGPGSTRTSWTVTGRRQNGTTFTLHRSDIYTDTHDASFAAPDELYNEMVAIARARPQRFDAVTTRSRMTTNAGRYQVAGLAVATGGTWQPVPPAGVVRLSAGATVQLRVHLVSSRLAPRNVVLDLAVPSGTAGASGSLRITGGSSYGTNVRGSLDHVVAAIEHQPRNADVVADLALRGPGGAHRSQVRSSAGWVVTGSRSNAVTVRH